MTAPESIRYTAHRARVSRHAYRFVALAVIVAALLAGIDADAVVETTRALLRIPSFSGSEGPLAARLAEVSCVSGKDFVKIGVSHGVA